VIFQRFRRGNVRTKDPAAAIRHQAAHLHVSPEECEPGGGFPGQWLLHIHTRVHIIMRKLIARPVRSWSGSQGQLKKNKCQQRHIHSIPACVIPARNRRPAGSAKQAETQPHVHLIWTL